MTEAAKCVLPVANLREFFRDTLHDALQRQQVAVEDHTEHYVVNLLTLFARSEALYEQTPEGLRLKPLVTMLCESLEAPPDTPGRHRALQRLGDVSLFIAGFFARGFARKLVDIDYHIAMGGSAYRTLSHCTSHGRGRVLAGVFAVHSDRDILRLYEIWLKTGSARCYGQLMRLGVDPTNAGGTAFKH
jgi:hypothetical protein